MADMSVYDGIISPNGGLYRPGPEVVFPSQGSGLTTRQVKTVAVDPFTGTPIVAGQGGNMPAVRAALSDQTGVGIGGNRSGSVTYQAPALPNQPNGSIIATKSQDRLNSPEYDFAYGADNQNPALGAIQTAATTVPLPRPRPSRGFVGDPGDGGLFGTPMSPGMAQIIATQPQYAAQRGGVPPGVVAANPQVAQALAAQLQVAPAPPPVLPTYATTEFQQDRFQTTPGAQMPGSMNNSRWTTGY